MSEFLRAAPRTTTIHTPPIAMVPVARDTVIVTPPLIVILAAVAIQLIVQVFPHLRAIRTRY